MQQEFEADSIIPLVACLFVVPIIGWMVAEGLAFGDEADTIAQLAIGALAVGALALVVLILSPKIAAGSRNRVAALFGPGIRIILLCLAVSIVLQAILFVYSLFVIEASLIGRVHGGLMLVIGIGALVASATLINSALQALTIPPFVVRGELVPKDSQLTSHVASIAAGMKARSPNHIVVGLEPSFYVTAAPVKLIGDDHLLSGTTLFVSLPLMRLLSVAEFDAVLGHELGHFQGDDTKYSLKFAPLYSRLGSALTAMSNGSGDISDLGKLPAVMVLSSYIDRFARVERSIGRERELAADEMGAKVSSPHALATALLKVGVFSANWDWLTREHIASLNDGRTFTQLGSSFANVCAISADADWASILNGVAGSAQSHPIDTHPTFSERLSALGVPMSALTANDCATPENSASDIVDGRDDIDQRLSVLEAQWLLAIRAATLPPESS